jgi:DNA-binding NarL/FixJ family response regulator
MPTRYAIGFPRIAPQRKNAVRWLMKSCRLRSAWMLILGIFVTGPRPAGRPWTAAERELHQLLASGAKAAAIARKLKRSTGTIYTRANSLKKKLPTSALSLPSE